MLPLAFVAATATLDAVAVIYSIVAAVIQKNAQMDLAVMLAVPLTRAMLNLAFVQSHSVTNSLDADSLVLFEDCLRAAVKGSLLGKVTVSCLALTVYLTAAGKTTFKA